MTLLYFCLVLAAAVLASAVFDQLVRGVSMPLIQIAIGAVLALCGVTVAGFEVDSELFLVLFIAPLLYQEARSVDKVALWSNRIMILSLAIGLVIVTILVVGFLLSAIQPSIPLAAAFALGAALGPTDAVAVAALGQSAGLNKRQEILLSGESLINDASGVVSFQFAVAALTTGAFSLVDASASFAVSFFGGILLGLVLAAVLSFAVARVRDLGLEDTTFHVLVDIITPFFIFLVAEAVHVSGILAVVAAGLIMSFFNHRIGPDVARMEIVSSSVWQVVTFVLNGIVFVLLGMQLPFAMSDSWADRSIGNLELVGLVLAISAASIIMRTIWFQGINFVGRKQRAREEQKNSGGTPEQVRAVLKSVKFVTGESLREAFALALAGPKGAISLSIMFTLPYMVGGEYFHERDLLIFLACGVIVLTLLLANFALPLLLPKREEEGFETDTQAVIDVLRAVIEDLSARQTKENRRATQVVMKQYSDRIARIKSGLDDEPDEDDAEMRRLVLKWERDFVQHAIDAEEVSPMTGYRMLNRLAETEALMNHNRDIRWFLGVARRRISMEAHSIKRFLVDKVPMMSASDEEREMRELQAKSLESVMSKLRELLNDPAYRTEDVSALMVEVQRDLRRCKRIGRDIDTVARVEDRATEVRRLGYALELEHIQRMYESRRISRAMAKYMRENVALMQLDLEDKV